MKKTATNLGKKNSKPREVNLSKLRYHLCPHMKYTIFVLVIYIYIKDLPE